MTRGSIAALVAIAFCAGLALRLVRLDVRPMHHDEANQAVKFGALLERGEYRYDFRDHHGPTLYYLSLPAAWLRGQHTLASLDECTLRGVTAVAGAATIALLPLVAGGIGRPAVAAGAWLMALSPAMVFYSRMFIQESLFTCFTIAFAIAIGRVTVGGGLGWSAAAGLAAGLALSTKETSVIVLPAALLSCAVAAWSTGIGQPRVQPASRRWPTILGVAAAVAAIVAALFYSSFLAEPRGVFEPFRGAATYFQRGTSPSGHAHPWHSYLHLLAFSSSGGLKWSEALVLALGAIGTVAAWSRRDPGRAERTFWTRYLACYAVSVTAIFSAIPYKTPWNLLPFHAGMILLAGVGFACLAGASRSRLWRGALTAGLVIGCVHLGWQAWRASITYAADPRNPYVYAQTVRDAVRMAKRIRDVAAVHPDGANMQVSVIASPYEQWPLPWYLRTMPNVGYWQAPGDPLALKASVVVASLDHTAALDAALGDRYVSEFYGLRPDVLLALYIERGLWDRYLAQVAKRDAADCGRAVRATVDCGPAPVVSLWRAPGPTDEVFRVPFSSRRP